MAPPKSSMRHRPICATQTRRQPFTLRVYKFELPWQLDTAARHVWAAYISRELNPLPIHPHSFSNIGLLDHQYTLLHHAVRLYDAHATSKQGRECPRHHNRYFNTCVYGLLPSDWQRPLRTAALSFGFIGYIRFILGYIHFCSNTSPVSKVYASMYRLLVPSTTLSIMVQPSPS